MNINELFGFSMKVLCCLGLRIFKHKILDKNIAAIGQKCALINCMTLKLLQYLLVILLNLTKYLPTG